jgi:hypothetical protein
MYRPQVEEILRLLAEGAEAKVAASAKRKNPQIRESLRNLMRLNLNERRFEEKTTGGQRVPIRVVGTMPEPVRNLLAERKYRQVLERIAGYRHVAFRLKESCQHLIGLCQSLMNEQELAPGTVQLIVLPEDPEAHLHRLSEMEEAFRRASAEAEHMLAMSEKAELLKDLFSIREDVLGAYFSGSFDQRVELYWVVIGAVARLLGLNVEDLTTVVLTHELAHAYSHLGLDSDGERWEDHAFHQSDCWIVEGIAQWYTKAVVEDLSRKDGPGVVEAYQRLLQIQHGPYRWHDHWPTLAHKEMRSTLLTVRRWEKAAKRDLEYHLFDLDLSGKRVRNPRRGRYGDREHDEMVESLVKQIRMWPRWSEVRADHIGHEDGLPAFYGNSRPDVTALDPDGSLVLFEVEVADGFAEYHTEDQLTDFVASGHRVYLLLPKDAWGEETLPTLQHILAEWHLQGKVSVGLQSPTGGYSWYKWLGGALSAER